MDLSNDCHSQRAFAGRVLWFVLQRRGTLPMRALRDHVLKLSPWRAEIEPGALERYSLEQSCRRRHEILTAAIAACLSAESALGNLSLLLEEEPFNPFSKRHKFSEVYENCFEILRESAGEITDEDVAQLPFAMSWPMRRLDRAAVEELLAC